MRVSLDHHTPALHDLNAAMAPSPSPWMGCAGWRGKGSRSTSPARASFGGEEEVAMRAGYARLFAEHGIAVTLSIPLRWCSSRDGGGARRAEISTACWGILDRAPEEMMCASSRMVVKRKGAGRPSVVACTLLPHDPRFELGVTLAEAWRPVALNHPHCARFCVLGWGRLLQVSGRHLQLGMATGGAVVGLLGVFGALRREGAVEPWVLRLFAGWCVATPYWWYLEHRLLAPAEPVARAGFEARQRLSRLVWLGFAMATGVPILARGS
jgi:hypothetical protein